MVRRRGCGNVVTDHQMVVRWHLRHQSTPFNTICAPHRINLVAPTSKGMGRWMVVQKGAVQPPPNEGMGRWVVVQKGACSPPQHLPINSRRAADLHQTRAPPVDLGKHTHNGKQ